MVGRTRQAGLGSTGSIKPGFAQFRGEKRLNAKALNRPQRRYFGD